jgi:hypothetical protein
MRCPGSEDASRGGLATKGEETVGIRKISFVNSLSKNQQRIFLREMSVRALDVVWKLVFQNDNILK